ncbi:hypothetical protein I4F81_010807 [Pyropia yezoensis]|uniref:Uncharacterized protein n=1 Tax=Pyropia yezoensis TaxID=2788 RepID=A0ACC3CEP2_PYRYE|nr:hypothetical protein I4F81_010807 [Neopyropia yezoensis]
MACPSPSRCAARAVAPRHRCYFGNLQGYRLAAALDLPRIELPAKARTVASGLGRVTGGRGGGVEVWWRTQLQRPAVAVPVRCNGTPAASPLLPSPVPHPTAPRRRPLVGDIGWPRRVHAFDLATPVGAPLRTVPLGLVHHGWYGACIIILQSFRAGGCRCRPRHAPARPAAPNGQTAMRFPRYHGTFLPPRQSRPAPPPPPPPFSRLSASYWALHTTALPPPPSLSPLFLPRGPTSLARVAHGWARRGERPTARGGARGGKGARALVLQGKAGRGTAGPPTRGGRGGER